MNLETKKFVLKQVVKFLLPILSCIIGLHQTVIGVIGYDLSNIPGDLGDSRFNMYILEHGYQYITIQVKKLWDVPFMYPAQNILAFSDNLLGSMPVYALFRILSFDRETSFQFWIIAVSILNFASALYTLKKLTKSYLLATAGAYIFAFSFFLFSQLNHQQVFPRFIVPFVIYWLLRYSDEFKLKYALFTMLGVVYQFYCGMYLGFMLAMVSAVLFLVLLAFNFKKALGQHFFTFTYLSKLITFFNFSILIIAPLAIPYWKVSQILQPRSYETVFLSLPLPQSYFFSTHISYVWKFLSKHYIVDNVPWWDHQIFIGLVPWFAFIGSLLFAASKLFKWLKPLQTTAQNNDQIRLSRYLIPASISLFICILLTIRIGDFSLYKWVYHIPGFSSMANILRIMNVFLCLFAFIVCLLAFELVKQKQTLWFALLLICVFIDNLTIPKEYGHFGKKDSQNRLSPIVKQLNQVDWKSKDAFAYIPDFKDRSPTDVQLDGMLASQLVHKPCVNGYSSTSPEHFSPFWINYDINSLNFWLDAHGVDHSRIAIIK